MTKSVLTESVNRSFGLVVNGIRLRAIRNHQEKRTEDFLVDDLMTIAWSFSIGQGGNVSYLKDIRHLEPKTVPSIGGEFPFERLKKAIIQLAPKWDAEILDTSVRFTVDLS